MKNAIAKLMIATMVIDSDIDQRETEVIKENIEILGITDKEYDELLSEAKEINGLDDFLAWTQPSLDALNEQDDPELSGLAVRSMMLVAYADGKIKDVESDFIKSTASILGIANPTFGIEEWIPRALAREISKQIRKMITNTDNE